MRILHAPSNVANIAWAMAEGLRGRGHHVEVWNHGRSPNDFPVDRVFDVGREPADYVRCLLEALDADFDVFHFHGHSLIPWRLQLPALWDLPILSGLGKQIVFTFHGSDIRLASHHKAADRWSYYRCADIPCDEERIKERLEIVSSYADHMTVGSVLDLPYAPQAVYLPKPIDVGPYSRVGTAQRRRPLVLHATRRRATKGTEFILRAVDAALERVHFDFRLIEGVDHAELLAAMSTSDIVVDKVLGGDAGVLSLEAMAMGKVAVARISDKVRKEHPDMPVVSANPETIAQTLVRLVGDRALRVEHAERGRSYVEANHSPGAAASRLEELYASTGSPAVVPQVWRPA